MRVQFSLAWLLALLVLVAADLALFRVGAGPIGYAVLLLLVLCLDFPSERYRLLAAGIVIFSQALLDVIFSSLSR
jgi:hypothetical protein